MLPGLFSSTWGALEREEGVFLEICSLPAAAALFMRFCAYLCRGVARHMHAATPLQRKHIKSKECTYFPSGKHMFFAMFQKGEGLSTLGAAVSEGSTASGHGLVGDICLS